MRRFTATAAIVAVLMCAPTFTQAQPSTPEIEAKQAEATAAQTELQNLATQLEMRTEEYYAITAELQDTRDEIADTRLELERADAQLAEATGLLEQRAEGMYRNGNVDVLEVLLGTTSFQDFLTRMDWLMRIGRNDAELIAAVKDARAEVQKTEQALERREEEQAQLRGEAKVKKAEMEDAVARQKSYVNGLNEEVTRLIAEEEERQRVLAEERARQAAEAARLAAEAAQRNTAGSDETSGAYVPTPVDLASLGPGHPEALNAALKYIGVPYVWGGTTPSGFDCSGLTQYVYAEIGISIPRTSRSQFASGAHIPADRLDLLVPGDLVFFGYNADPTMVHHVGIYAGSGNYLHAPYTGATVRVDSLIDRINSVRDYVGASRF